jgi:O-acetyl-ADP-ribose deacetylase (regulator of RNase III)
MIKTLSRSYGGGKVVVVIADITTVHADAVVNAANSRLAGGGGVDGAIHSAAGPALMRELREKYDGCPTGSAVITGGGDLPAAHVIHAVGPIWSGGDNGEPQLLKDAYTRAFSLASENLLRTVAVASVSTGIYGYPLELAAPIALAAAKEALEKEGTSLVEIRWALFNQPTFDAFANALDSL